MGLGSFTKGIEWDQAKVISMKQVEAPQSRRAEIITLETLMTCKDSRIRKVELELKIDSKEKETEGVESRGSPSNAAGLLCFPKIQRYWLLVECLVTYLDRNSQHG